uniref:Uncharacterized protein n=1 Tax=Rhizophora mucronata TaxID=61149 RepID=A0A2P2Q7W0_RHIMU
MANWIWGNLWSSSFFPLPPSPIFFQDLEIGFCSLWLDLSLNHSFYFTIIPGVSICIFSCFLGFTCLEIVSVADGINCFVLPLI